MLQDSCFYSSVPAEAVTIAICNCAAVRHSSLCCMRYEQNVNV